MSEPNIETLADKASLILQAIVQATEVADGDVGKVQTASNWLILIGAAAQYAHYLLTEGHCVETQSEGVRHV